MKTRLLAILGLVFILAACSPVVKTISVKSEEGKCTLEGGSRISAGEVMVKWNIKDKAPSFFGLWILTLDKDKGYQDLVDYLNTDTWRTDFPPSWSKWQGDIFPAKPDSQNEKTFLFQDGPLYLVCFFGDSTVITNNESDVESNRILGPVEVVR